MVLGVKDLRPGLSEGGDIKQAVWRGHREPRGSKRARDLGKRAEVGESKCWKPLVSLTRLPGPGGPS